MLFGLSNMQLLAVGLVVLSLCLYKRHMSQIKNQEGSDFKMQAGYRKLSPFKHDVFKGFVAEILPILLLSNNPGELFNFNNPTGNIVSRAVIIFVYYLVFYHFVEPYIANQTTIF